MPTTFQCDDCERPCILQAGCELVPSTCPYESVPGPEWFPVDKYEEEASE
jgi:hypothetical protein